MANAPSIAFIEALTAALLWAISAPVITFALKRVRDTKDSLFSVALGLNTATITGLLVLTAIRGFPSDTLLLDPRVICAGVLTFPIGTGIYYVAAVKFNNQAAIAAQFANVKPVLTIFAGYLLFKESLDTYSWISAALILSGIAIIIRSAFRRSMTLSSIVLGMTLAVVWALGEFCVRLAAIDLNRFDIAHAALTVSTPFSLIGLSVAFYLKNSRICLPQPSVFMAFAVHGGLSFAGAYFFFFASIARQGLAQTTLVTTFWPTIAMCLSLAFDKSALRKVPSAMLIGMGLFTFATVIQVVSRL